MAKVVVDASALLALLNSEQGAEAVAKALPGAVIGSVNLCEVIGKLAETGMKQEEIGRILFPLGLTIETFDEEQAYTAGILRISTKSAGLSLGDRACLGLAKKLGVPVLTADRRWLDLAIGVKVTAIR